MILHPIEPIFNENSEVLILGSFPSVKSREEGFYYAHPQNRFWRVISRVLNQECPQTNEEKRKMLLDHHIAVWDVIHSCEIVGSSDSSIREVAVNDLAKLLKQTKVKKIYCNGGKAYALYNRYLRNELKIEAIGLPSTSPANAKCSLEQLVECYKGIVD